jgi:predicted permease
MMFSDLLYRIRALVWRRDVEAEMDDEIRFHMEKAVEKYRRSGLTATEAERRARLDLGGMEPVREACRDARGTRWLEDTAQDLRYALRILRKVPLFAAVAVGSLALGIGANTAIFTMIDALLLKPLPVRDPQSLVSLGQGADDDSATYALWREIRQRQDIFSEMFASGGAGDFDLSAGGEKQPAGGLYVSGSYFATLGVRARLGRGINEADDQRGAAPVAVLSYDFWQRHYAGDRNIVGRTIRLDNHVFEIIGVIERGFFGTYVGEMFEVAVPIACEPLFHPDGPYMDGQHYWWLTIFGRLKPGVDLRRASARLDVWMPPIFHGLFPDDPRKPPYMVLKPAGRGMSYLRGEYGASLILLMAMVGLVLLMACSNLANLLLARAGARGREVAVRLALGASRGRLVRLLITESLILSLSGAALGVVMARWASGVMVAWISPSWQRGFMNLSPDWRVLAFTAGLAVLTGVLCGLAPALRATRPAARSALKEGTRG